MRSLNLDQVKSQDYSRASTHKLWIASLHNQSLQKEQAEFSPAYVQLHNKKISRINIIANITQTYRNEASTYAALTLDDSSAQIRVKAWNEDIKKLGSIQPGDCILVIGKIREYNNEIYLTPEIIRKQHPDWFLARQYELLQLHGKPPTVKEDLADIDLAAQPAIQATEEKIQQPQSESKRQQLMLAISTLDQELGASITEVILASSLPESEAQAILKELLQEGEIFKLTADRVKIT